MSTHPDIVQNALRVRERCREAASRSGRPPNAVTLIAAAKTQPLERVLAALEAGVLDIGENRVQEAEEKWTPTAREEVRLHLIGRLQRNKARKATRLFDLIHSCDTPALAQRLSEVSEGRAIEILIEVNVSGEASKAGFAPHVLREEIHALGVLPNLALRGLMTIAPAASDPERSRPFFEALRALSDKLRGLLPTLGQELSMGMTDDYEVAIEEGATMVRVGRAIFGERANSG
ncbi:MAG: YggS family pyridoxal phosphate-dependent enzyme [Chloroflexota bacterium]|nr:YggS family pyridoxal phosphate-dependent enzyme [Chloroflexota bacterium]